MDDTISKLAAVRSALGTLEISSTRHNLDTLLGSMQLLDRVIVRLQQLQADNKEQTE